MTKELKTLAVTQYRDEVVEVKYNGLIYKLNDNSWLSDAKTSEIFLCSPLVVIDTNGTPFIKFLMDNNMNMSNVFTICTSAYLRFNNKPSSFRMRQSKIDAISSTEIVDNQDYFDICKLTTRLLIGGIKMFWKQERIMYDVIKPLALAQIDSISEKLCNNFNIEKCEFTSKLYTKFRNSTELSKVDRDQFIDDYHDIMRFKRVLAHGSEIRISTIPKRVLRFKRVHSRIYKTFCVTQCEISPSKYYTISLDGVLPECRYQTDLNPNMFAYILGFSDLDFSKSFKDMAEEGIDTHAFMRTLWKYRDNNPAKIYSYNAELARFINYVCETIELNSCRVHVSVVASAVKFFFNNNTPVGLAIDVLQEARLKFDEISKLLDKTLISGECIDHKFFMECNPNTPELRVKSQCATSDLLRLLIHGNKRAEFKGV